jgi:Predicted membrane protein
MIREFLYKYYIDPIRYGEAYTLVDTLTYALILIAAVYLVYRGLRRYRIAIDDELVLATLPFVVLGGLLRVVEDTGMITSDLHFLLITPLIFFTIFAVAAIALFLGKLTENAGLTARYSRVYGGPASLPALSPLRRSSGSASLRRRLRSMSSPSSSLSRQSRRSPSGHSLFTC